jgi:hypothetical protein
MGGLQTRYIAYYATPKNMRLYHRASHLNKGLSHVQAQPGNHSLQYEQ